MGGEHRALPTNKSLDRRKLIEIFQQLVQGVSVLWSDGVLVLEQELDGAREEGEQQRRTGREGQLGMTQQPSHPCGDCKVTRFREGQAVENLQDLDYFLA